MLQKIVLSTVSFTFIGWSSLQGFHVTEESEKVFAVEVGYCGLWRSPLKGMEFITQGGSEMTPFSKIRFNYVSGVRALVEMNLGPKNSIDAVYTGLFNWNNEESGTDPLYTFTVPTAPYDNVDWTDFYYFRYHYKSELNSGELSYWRHVTPRYVDYFSFSWMLGLRYIDFRDSIHMNNGTGSVGNTASVKVINRMAGAQAGLELQCNSSRRFTWAIQVKGGGYADFAWRKTVFYDLGNTELLVDSKQDRVKSDFTLEMIPYIMYRWNPVYFRLAYDRIILFNPVFAPRQLADTKSVNEVYTHNYVNFQAVYISIGTYW